MLRGTAAYMWKIPYHIQTVGSPHVSTLCVLLSEGGCLHTSSIVGEGGKCVAAR